MSTIISNTPNLRNKITLPRRRRSELSLMFLAVIVILGAYVLQSLGVAGKIPDNLNLIIPATVIFCVGINILNRALVPNADPVIMPVAVLLNGLGFAMIARLDAFNYVHHLRTNFALFQAMWSGIGITCYVLTLAIVRRSRDLDRYRYIFGLFAMIMLFLPLVPHFGESISGARLWIHLGGLIFQPVELAKIALVIFLASYFVDKRELLSTSTMRIGNFLLPDPRALGPVVAAAVISIGAMAAEHDVGFGLLLFVLFLSMLWVTTGRLSFVFMGVLFFALALYVGLDTFVGAHHFAQVHERISVWLNPWKHASGNGYQIIQATIALARGSIAGTGLGLGKAGLYVPVIQSDFIFTAFGEELGLFGSVAILTGFCLIVGSGLRISTVSRSEFAKMVATGLSVLLGFQALFILAGITRLLPLTGVTLPFVSYGGSSLVSNYILLAILMRISSESNTRYQNPDYVEQILSTR